LDHMILVSLVTRSILSNQNLLPDLTLSTIPVFHLLRDDRPIRLHMMLVRLYLSPLYQVISNMREWLRKDQGVVYLPERAKS
jgi:hypothetical protein